MIDMHSHILPGIDDGAKDMEEAIAIAEAASKNGVQAMFATPHYIEGIDYKNPQYNHKVMEELKGELKKRNIPIELYLGNEVYIAPNLLTLLEKGAFTTLNTSRYILMELPMMELPLYTETVIYEMRLKGLVPIIAHPERNATIIEDINRLYHFIKKGALAQLNIGSLLGKYGEEISKTAFLLLQHDMIHFIGTDVHTPGQKSLNPQYAIDLLEDVVDTEILEKLFYHNPQRVIDDESLSIWEPTLYKGKKGFLKRLFKLGDS